LQNNSTGLGARQSSDAAPIGIPQRPQNFVPAGYSCRQRGQVTPIGLSGEVSTSVETGWKVVLPQRPQNDLPASFN